MENFEDLSVATLVPYYPALSHRCVYTVIAQGVCVYRLIRTCAIIPSVSIVEIQINLNIIVYHSFDNVIGITLSKPLVMEVSHILSFHPNAGQVSGNEVSVCSFHSMSFKL